MGSEWRVHPPFMAALMAAAPAANGAAETWSGKIALFGANAEAPGSRHSS